MDDEKIMVPYYIYEGELARHERTIKRLILTIVMVVALLFTSNALWLYEWTCYDYVNNVTVDGKEGTANYIGNDGSITNGKDRDQEKKDSEKSWESQENKDQS